MTVDGQVGEFFPATTTLDNTAMKVQVFTVKGDDKAFMTISCAIDPAGPKHQYNCSVVEGDTHVHIPGSTRVDSGGTTTMTMPSSKETEVVLKFKDKWGLGG